MNFNCGGEKITELYTHTPPPPPVEAVINGVVDILTCFHHILLIFRKLVFMVLRSYDKQDRPGITSTVHASANLIKKLNNLLVNDLLRRA